ncbi:MAG: pirin family protein [Promethearchaeota archaeon]
MITIRNSSDLYRAGGHIKDGTFQGRWHFSFDRYRDPNWVHFGTLRVFNDDILSPGATWPLHPHRRNEVVTYVVKGEFKHADEHGEGGIMTKGDVQHTTIGKGMYHAEINNRKDEEMRFIQLWFFPEEEGLDPSVSQKQVDQKDRTNKLLPLVSNRHRDALKIRSDAEVYASYLENGKTISFEIKDGWGVYLVPLEGGNLKINNQLIELYGAAKIEDEKHITIKAEGNVEVLLLHVSLAASYIQKYV